MQYYLTCTVYRNVYVLLIVALYEPSLVSPKTGLSISLPLSTLSFSLPSISWRRFRGPSKASWRTLAPSTCGVGLRAEGTGDFSRYPVPTELTEPPLFGLLLKKKRKIEKFYPLRKSLSIRYKILNIFKSQIFLL